jgi:hypothetical protein
MPLTKTSHFEFQVNTEDPSNNFIGIRHMAGSAFGDSLYAEFQTGNQYTADISFGADEVDFIEVRADQHNPLPS